MQPFNEQVVVSRFLNKVADIKNQTGETEGAISIRLSGSKDRISNIKRGLASVDLEILHNLEQIYGVDQYEITTGISILHHRQALEQSVDCALNKLQELKRSFGK